MELSIVITLKQCMMKVRLRRQKQGVVPQIVGHQLPLQMFMLKSGMKRFHFFWTSPDVNNLGVPYTESFDEGGLLDLWLVDGGDNWLYDEATGNPAPSLSLIHI